MAIPPQVFISRVPSSPLPFNLEPQYQYRIEKCPKSTSYSSTSTQPVLQYPSHSYHVSGQNPDNVPTVQLCQETNVPEEISFDTSPENQFLSYVWINHQEGTSSSEADNPLEPTVSSPLEKREMVESPQYKMTDSVTNQLPPDPDWTSVNPSQGHSSNVPKDKIFKKTNENEVLALDTPIKNQGTSKSEGYNPLVYTAISPLKAQYEPRRRMVEPPQLTMSDSVTDSLPEPECPPRYAGNAGKSSKRRYPTRKSPRMTKQHRGLNREETNSPNSGPSTREQQATESEIHIRPEAVQAPFRTETLSLEERFQLMMLESAHSHMPLPMDSEPYFNY